VDNANKDCQTAGADALLPWMTMPETQAIETLLNPDWHVLEYGSGASTAWFAARVKRVTSIEHNWRWANALDQLPTNVDLRFVPPEWPLKRKFGPAEPGQFATYVDAADDISPNFVLVDGRDRVSCANRWAPRAIVVLHDSKRRRYRSLNLTPLCGTLAIVEPVDSSS
jgi:hypothetical protein